MLVEIENTTMKNYEKYFQFPVVECKSVKNCFVIILNNVARLNRMLGRNAFKRMNLLENYFVSDYLSSH